MMMTGKGRVAGVIGWPIGHSRSPQLHSYWLRTYGIDGAYVPLAVRPEVLTAAVRGLVDLGFRGVNATVPHKEGLLAVLDEVTPEARRIGAVNTVVIGQDGRTRGSNTDGEGFLRNLEQALPGWSVTGKPTTVLGAGGAARAVLVALLDAGAGPLRIVNRNRDRATALAEAIGATVEVVDWVDRDEALADQALVVNTTSLGMVDQPALELRLHDLPRDAVVTDLVYAPLMTPLLTAAQVRGNRVVDGLGMLLHQAVPGFAAWFGVTPTVTRALRDAVLADPA